MWGEFHQRWTEFLKTPAEEEVRKVGSWKRGVENLSLPNALAGAFFLFLTDQPFLMTPGMVYLAGILRALPAWKDFVATAPWNRLETFQPQVSPLSYWEQRKIASQMDETLREQTTGTNFRTQVSVPRPPYTGMQIFIKTLTGSTKTMQVRITDRVEHVKHFLEESEGIPPMQQRLIYAGRQLENGMMLHDVGVNPECTLHLVLRLGGC